MTNNLIIDATRQWIETVVVKYNFCPFARKELETDGLDYVICENPRLDSVLDVFEHKCAQMLSPDSPATSLVIVPQGFDDFERYLDLVDLAQTHTLNVRFDGILQLASFHPDYCFGGCEVDDAANYTNRSPYPMLHILKEQNVTAALEEYDDPESIPDKNIALARRKGLATFKQLLQACTSASTKD